MRAIACSEPNKPEIALLLAHYEAYLALLFKGFDMRVILTYLRGAACFLVISLSTGLADERHAIYYGPAELPPVGFTGNQFVDSKGCVYIRTGGSGEINWTPRLTSKLEMVCGFAPSFKQGSTLSKVVNPKSLKAPAEAKKPGLVSSNAELTPKNIVQQTQPATKSHSQTNSHRIENGRKGLQVPLSMQTVRGYIGPTQVPAGYRVAWEDDRLNPARGLQSVSGLRASDRIWSRTVPREMGFPQGKSATRANDRKLVYPFTNIEQQAAFLEAKGAYILQPQDGGAITLVPRANAIAGSGITNASTGKGGGALVQVATFGVIANAEKTKSRLSAMGLPVRERRLARSGKNYRVIFVGPFADAAQTKTALAAARRAGFSDAFIVRR